MDNLIKIECETEEVIKSKKTGKIYQTMEDFLKENNIEDLQKDVSVTIPRGFDIFQKVMNIK